MSHIPSELKAKHIGEMLALLPSSVFGTRGIYGFLVQGTKVNIEEVCCFIICIIKCSNFRYFGGVQETPCPFNPYVCPSVCQAVQSRQVHIFIMKNIVLTKIAYDQWLCHDFDPKSFLQVQGHWKETCIILYCFLMEKH